jgi:DNA-binding transcriptional LysR family regulator
MSNRARNVDWEDLRSFAALAEAGTLSEAARRLRVTHATVSRRLAALEDALGEELFERRPDGYALTARGRAIADEVRTMQDAALSIVQRLDAKSEPRGLVRITTSRPLADLFLVPRLDAFYRAHPEIDLSLLVENRNVSLARHEADIALRLGSPKDSALLGRRVARLQFGFYAAPAYLKRRDTPPHMIGYDETSELVPEATWLDQTFDGARFTFRSNSQVSQTAAARAGFGVALLPHFMAASDPTLRLVDLGVLPPERELWLLLRPDGANVPRIRVVADALADLFKRDAKLFTAPGTKPRSQPRSKSG